MSVCVQVAVRSPSLTEPFACRECPPGAYCVNDLALAAEGFWQPPDAAVRGLALPTSTPKFFPCRALACQRQRANSSAAQANCYEGYTGPMCGSCAPGYSLQSQICVRCLPSSAWVNWHPASKAVVIVIAFALATLLLVVAIFQPLSPRIEDAVQAALSRTQAGFIRFFSSCFGGTTVTPAGGASRLAIGKTKSFTGAGPFLPSLHARTRFRAPLLKICDSALSDSAASRTLSHPLALPSSLFSVPLRRS